MNDVSKSIGWADYTWNPITGCSRGCSYCYARRIHDRFNKTIPFTSITYHADRLLEPDKLKKPARIFVGSMSDIEYWSKISFDIIIDICQGCPQHTFMFLSKNPLSYLGFKWPKNCMQGLTVTKADTFEERVYVEIMRDFPRPFLSIEPILGVVNFSTVHIERFEQVIVGAQTGPKKIIPKPEWIQSVQNFVPAEKIYWKSNIKKYLGVK